MLEQHGHHLILGLHVGFGQAQLGPQTVAPNEVGDRVLELGDDLAQGGLVGRCFEVQNGVDVDAELGGNAHGIVRRVSMNVVVDRCLGHPATLGRDSLRVSV